MKQTVKENKEPLKEPRIKNTIFNKLDEITIVQLTLINSLQILFLLE